MNGMTTMESRNDLPATRRARPAAAPRAVLAVIALSVGLGGCAAVAPRYVDSNDALVNRSLAVRVGSTPSFYADTPGRRMFGPFGAVAALRSGNQLIEDLAIDDPAHGISDVLVGDLLKANRMATVTDLSQAEVVLDVKTTTWDFRPYRNDPAQLFVVYAARVTLTERSTGRVLVKDRCRSGRDADDDRVSVEALLADDGRLLREELAEAARDCVAQIVSGPLRVALKPGLPPVARHEATAQTR